MTLSGLHALTIEVRVDDGVHLQLPGRPESGLVAQKPVFVDLLMPLQIYSEQVRHLNVARVVMTIGRRWDGTDAVSIAVVFIIIAPRTGSFFFLLKLPSHRQRARRRAPRPAARPRASNICTVQGGRPALRGIFSVSRCLSVSPCVPEMAMVQFRKRVHGTVAART